MFKNTQLVTCIVCEVCFNQIIKPNQLYCKKCQDKVRWNKTSDKKLLNNRYNKSSSDSVNTLKLAKKYIGN